MININDLNKLQTSQSCTLIKNRSTTNEKLYAVYTKSHITIIISEETDEYKIINIPASELIHINENNDSVIAIGIPYNYLITKEGTEEANKLLGDINTLMNEYEVDKPIIDTSDDNRLLMYPICHYNFVYKKSKIKSLN